MSQHLSPEELGKLFFEIDSQPSLKLSESAKVAGLSIAEDYIGADLSDEDLSEDNLSNANFTGANLSNADLHETNLSGAILNNADLSNANLSNADLSNADLSNADLSNADLSNANLSGANLFYANLYNSNLTQTNLSDANLRAGNLLSVKNIETAYLINTNLTNTTLGLSQKQILSLKQLGAVIEVGDAVRIKVVQGDRNITGDRNINTGGGNYNERIEGDYVQGNVFQNIFNILGGQTTIPVGNPARPKNERILLAAVKEEVTSRLRQSLHNAVLINLRKESQLQQVKRPWDAEIKIGLKPAEPLPDTTTILEVFDSEEIAGKLLILGAPGSGKTTTQLELAQALVGRAEEQPEYPVPVLFNLSSWKDDRQPLTDWLVAELKSKYGVSIKLGKDWVDNHQLLPLLDGLDELESQRQELCVHAINQFLAGENRPLYLVVCSRSEEYSKYSTQLQFNGAIYLQPLTNNQICDYLTYINYIELWLTLSSDLDLLELIKTPLLLSITVLVSQEISVEEWQRLSSTADRIQYLLDAYVGRMFKRDINNARKTRMWLVWLAGQMLLESKTEFLIEEMQPSLLKTKIPKIIYNLIVWEVIQMLIYGWWSLPLHPQTAARPLRQNGV